MLDTRQLMHPTPGPRRRAPGGPGGGHGVAGGARGCQRGSAVGRRDGRAALRGARCVGRGQGLAPRGRLSITRKPAGASTLGWRGMGAPWPREEAGQQARERAALALTGTRRPHFGCGGSRLQAHRAQSSRQARPPAAAPGRPRPQGVASNRSTPVPLLSHPARALTRPAQARPTASAST
jgi:hypothetical protein